MRILVIGASRGIGRETVLYALERGHEVRGLARSAAEMGMEDAGFEAWPGDATRAEDVAGAVEGMDAVVLALGLPTTATALLKPTTLFSDATRVAVAAMHAAGVSRLLAVTGFGSGESRAKVSALEMVAFEGILGRAYADKTRQEEIIEGSGLDWTIARPGILTSNRRTGRYRVLAAPESWQNGMISRADVAHFLVHAIEAGTYVGQAPVLVR